MSPGRISVLTETPTGRNVMFRDNITGETMTRISLVGRIRNGDYPNYHVRNIDGIDTPVSNPDSTDRNNLD